MKKLLWSIGILFGLASLIAMPYAIYQTYKVYTTNDFLVFLIEAFVTLGAIIALIIISQQKLRELKRDKMLFPKGKLPLAE